MTHRQFPRKLKRVVIKVGSSLIANHLMKPRETSVRSLVRQICDLRHRGVEVVLVSSGAVVLGLGAMGEAGVSKALHLIRNELDLTMAFCGHTNIETVDKSILLPGTYPT